MSDGVEKWKALKSTTNLVALSSATNDFLFPPLLLWARASSEPNRALKSLCAEAPELRGLQIGLVQSYMSRVGLSTLWTQPRRLPSALLGRVLNLISSLGVSISITCNHLSLAHSLHKNTSWRRLQALEVHVGGWGGDVAPTAWFI